MRLIDADELIVMEYGGIKFIPKEFIDDATTIEERKKATWIEDGYRGLPCVCSYCGDEGTREWNFCPNCGADMRGENDEAD